MARRALFAAWFAALLLHSAGPLAGGTVEDGTSRLARAWYWAGKNEWHLATLEGQAAVVLLRAGDSNLPEALEVLGLSELMLGRAQLAFEHLVEGLAACPSCPDRSNLRLGLSSALRDLDRFDESEAILRQVLEDAEASGRRDIQVLAYKGLATVVVKRGQRATALPFLQKALQLTTDRSKPKENAELQESIGVLLTESMDGVGALQNLRAAEALYEAAGDRTSRWRLKTNLAKAMMALGRYDSAFGLFQEVEAACRESGDRHELARALSGLGLLLEKRGSAAEAQARYEEALALERATGDSMGEATLLGNLNRIALGRGQYGRAFALSEQSIAASRTPSDLQSEITSLLGSASVHIALSNGEEVSALIRRVSTLTDAGRTEAPLAQAVLEVMQLLLGNRWTEALQRSELALELARDLKSEVAERDILKLRAVIEPHHDQRWGRVGGLITVSDVRGVFSLG